MSPSSGSPQVHFEKRSCGQRAPAAFRYALLFILMLLLGCVEKSPQTSVSVTPAPQPDKSGNAIPPTPPADSPFRFDDHAANLQIAHVYQNGSDAGFFAILESLGGGVGMLDFDHDGMLDLFLPGGGRFDAAKVSSGRDSSLYRQRFSLSSARSTFVEVSSLAKVADSPHYSHGGIVSDYDNDGFDDILLTGYGGLQLFHNQGDGTFQQQAAEAGLNDSLWSSSAAWGDFNGDGANDLYVAHYVDWSPDHDPQCFTGDGVTKEICPPRTFSGLPDSLYLSDVVGGFQNANDYLKDVPPSKGLGVATADVDLDGDLDIYVTNDTVMNFLLFNEDGKKFVESGTSSATGFGDTGRGDGSMGVDIGDYNGDGQPDIWVTNYENETFALYRSFDGHIFQHVSRSTGIAAACGLSVGWGTVFGDLDLDGDEDLFAATGHVIRHPANSPLRQRPLLLLNENKQRFRDVAALAGDYTSGPHMSRGVATGDLDNDGDLDIVVSNINEPIAVLINESEPVDGWLQLELIGIQSPRWAEGAWVEFLLDDGRKILRLRKGGTSYASTSDRRIHVGPGKARQIVEAIIHWPSGIVQRVQQLPKNQLMRIVESAEP